MGTIKVSAKNVTPGDQLVLGEDGQTAKVTKTKNTGVTVTIETATSIRNCRPGDSVEIVVGSE